MSKIFALSGSHGVGKTTLINKLTDFYKNKNDVKIFYEFNTGLFNVGFALNGKGKDFDEILFSQKIAFDLYKKTIDYYFARSDYDLVILDRSFIDTYIYSYYFAKFHNLSKKQKETLQAMFDETIKSSNKIQNILVPPFNSFADEVNRMSESSRNDIWQEFLQFFDTHFKHNYISLKFDNSNDRFNEVISLINKK